MDMATIDTKDYFTTAQAAAELELSTETVKKYCQKQIISGLKFGNSWMVPKKEIRRYMKERKERGRPTTSE